MDGFRPLDSLSALDAGDWDALHDGGNPFLAHAFLAGLERTDCLNPDWGWRARHATLWRGGRLVAAAPGYLKTNSHGEFVFDQVWAEAYRRAGGRYYPKWLIGIPYTPVTGPRLLAVDATARDELLAGIVERARGDGLSSVHVNFLPEPDQPAFGPEWLAREDVQFHWRNRGWPDFDAFLAALQAKKRKNIRQERAQVAAAGYRFRIRHGDEADEGELAAMHGFYLRTFADYGNAPALTLDFFRHLARAMPRQLVLILAERDGAVRAGALCLRGRDTLYGRYWGSTEDAPGLHFETCYYQGIAYCLREGLPRFEPGAGGEHKIARGFLPAATGSRHWVADARFAQALAPWCASEREAVDQYRRHAEAKGPYA